MIAILDYEAGNLASVSNAMKRLDEPHIITNKREELNQADGIIFPGQGHARQAMKSLQKHRLDEWLIRTEKPVLGICIGMQLFYEASDEGGDTAGLGIIPGRLKKFDSTDHKVPHMGWNTFHELVSEDEILEKISKENYFYYVHSYYAPINEFTLASCHYIREFSSVVRKDNYIGVQFHVEKSGKQGARLLQNFLTIANN